jgi:hypothetical protein
VREWDKELEGRARAIIKQIDSLLTEFIDLLKPHMDPVDQWELEKEAVWIAKALSSWVDAVVRSKGGK